MARYTFTCEHFDYESFEGLASEKVVSRHTTEFRAADLTTMLENFELFLRGSGFHFNGVIDIVNPDEDFFSDEEIEMFSEPLETNVWSKIVERHMTDIENETIQRGTCEVCKLPLETMLQHNCYDDQCPLKMK
jgi:hypothetical protein